MKTPIHSLIVLLVWPVGQTLSLGQTNHAAPGTELNGAQAERLTSGTVGQQTQPGETTAAAVGSSEKPRNADAKTTTSGTASDLSKRIQAVTTTPSPVVAAVAKMAESGVEPTVIESYVQTANVPAPRPDEILYLHERGVSSQVITAMIKRAAELRSQQVQSNKGSQERLAQTPPVVQTPMVQPATYNYYVTAPPTYTYSVPSYAYAYAYANYPIFDYSYVRPYSSVWPTWPSWPSHRTYSSAFCWPASRTIVTSPRHSHRSHHLPWTHHQAGITHSPRIGTSGRAFARMR